YPIGVREERGVVVRRVFRVVGAGIRRVHTRLTQCSSRRIDVRAARDPEADMVEPGAVGIVRQGPRAGVSDRVLRDGVEIVPVALVVDGSGPLTEAEDLHD